jgi:trigger factor
LSFPLRTWTSQLNEKLAEAKGKMQIKGFRPGKVPISHIKKVYGKLDDGADGQ